MVALLNTKVTMLMSKHKARTWLQVPVHLLRGDMFWHLPQWFGGKNYYFLLHKKLIEKLLNFRYVRWLIGYGSVNFINLTMLPSNVALIHNNVQTNFWPNRNDIGIILLPNDVNSGIPVLIWLLKMWKIPFNLKSKSLSTRRTNITTTYSRSITPW